MKRTSTIAVLLLGAMSLTCCNKKDHYPEPPIGQKELNNCYNNIGWNEQKLKEALVGRWLWIFTQSYWVPENGHSTREERMVLDFRNDSTLSISKDGNEVITTAWQLDEDFNGLYHIESDIFVAELDGSVLICNNIFQCFGSAKDGDDNYYERMD